MAETKDTKEPAAPAAIDVTVIGAQPVMIDGKELQPGESTKTKPCDSLSFLMVIGAVSLGRPSETKKGKA